MTQVSRARRLHLLSGVFPLGAFTIQHLVVMMAAASGQERFGAVAGPTASTARTVFDVVFVLVPLAYHVAYGIGLALRERPDAATDPLGRRSMAVLMRASSVIALVFVLAHLWQFRFKESFGGLAPASIFDELAASYSSTWLGVPWVALGTIVGSAATIFHFVYGLVSFWDRYGEPSSPASRRRAFAMSLALGSSLFLLATFAVVSVATGSRLLPATDPGTTLPCGPQEAASADPGRAADSRPGHVDRPSSSRPE